MPNELPEKLGRYKIVKELGKGAMGVVYEGLDPNIGRRVAIKTARRDVMEATGMADEMMERFLREARAAGGLNHPNIITIYDAGEENDIAFIAMEYLEGGDLLDLIEKKKRFEPEEVAELGATIVDALAVAHEHGITHRDIKPANIMVLTDGTLKIADFGIAHVSDSNLTQEGAMVGTPHYMSPEQFMGQKIDGRSDLFSTGIILYEMLTGEKPFTGEALSTVMHNAIKIDPVPPQELNFAVPDTLSAVIMKAMSKSPRQRYQTGSEMAAALIESLTDNPNPEITKVPGAISVTPSATVMSSPQANATVVTAPSPDATVTGAAPAHDAAGETAPVAAPPQEAPSVVEPPAKQAPAAPAPAPAKRGLPIVTIIGVLAAVGIVAAVVVMMMGGEGDSGAEGNYVGHVRMYVYLKPPGDTDALVELMETQEGPVFQSYNVGDNKNNGEEIELLEQNATLCVRVTQKGYKTSEVGPFIATQPGESIEIDNITLEKEG